MNTQAILDFLNELSKNNNREWFNENKPRYQELYQSMVLFSEMVINEVKTFDSSVAGIEPKKSVFRIYRDVRFSKDKSPYKTNMGMFITPGGKNAGMAGYYLHLEPTQSFIAGGIYMPPSKQLNAVRREIFNNASEFKEIIEDAGFKEYYGELQGEKLKRNPKDFPADFEEIELLKFKSYIVSHNFTNEDLKSPDFFGKVIDGFETLHPFNRYLNQALLTLS